MNNDEKGREARPYVHVTSATCEGIEGRGVIVEVYPTSERALEITGLSEPAARESRVRVRAALDVAGVEWPAGLRVYVAAPTMGRGPLKRTSGLDLAIAVGIAHSRTKGDAQLERLGNTLLVGELSLAGALRPVRGLVPMLRSWIELHERVGTGERPFAVIPHCQYNEARAVPGITCLGADTLADVLAWVDGGALHSLDSSGAVGSPAIRSDLSEVRGEERAKRALEVAAAGGHNLLLIGPPGAGKTMLARRLAELLPKLTPAEALEVATVQSAAGMGAYLEGHIARPFRAPHHTASVDAIVGGGDPVAPGEMTLAHHGVLFLDELIEFRRATIETVARTWKIGRANVHWKGKTAIGMPAKPLLVGAILPCPCGWRGSAQRVCSCSPALVTSYLARLQPVIDLFDVQIAIPSPQPVNGILPWTRIEDSGETSAEVRARVEAARARPKPDGISLLGSIEPAGIDLLVYETEARKLQAGPVIQLVNTIARLGGRHLATMDDVVEALSYRLVGAGEPLALPRSA